MAHLTIELPDELVAGLRAQAEAAHTTVEALLARHFAAHPPETVDPERRSAASFWGIGAGRPGAHGSVAAVDAYIRESRDEWDD